MLDFEIQKFNRVIDMKRYSVVRKLREEFPFLTFEVELGSDLSEHPSNPGIIVRAKEQYNAEYCYSLILRSDLDVVMKSISRISMYEDTKAWRDRDGVVDIGARKAKEEVTILFSSLFKREPGAIDGFDGLGRVFEMCTTEVIERLGNSYITFFTTYDRKLDGPGFDFKERLVRAMCRANLEYTSKTGRDELLMFKKHEMQLVELMMQSRASYNAEM